jgi:hypothetical protein
VVAEGQKPPQFIFSHSSGKNNAYFTFVGVIFYNTSILGEHSLNAFESYL